MERFFGLQKPSPQPRTKTGFADLLHELGCLYEKMIEQRREDVAKFELLGAKDDPLFDVDCSRRANAFKIASKNISTHDAPEELTEDSLALYTNLVGINNSVIALMEEYITKGEIRLLHGLRAMTGGVDYQEGNVFGGFLNIMKGFHQGLVIGFKTRDLDEMDDAGEEYAGTEDEKDDDAKWFRGLSKAWRLKLKSHYDEQMKKSLREMPGSKQLTTQVSKTGLGKVSDLISDEVEEKVEDLLCDMHDLELDADNTYGTSLRTIIDRFWPADFDYGIDEKSDIYARYGQIMVKHGYAEYAHDYYQERMAELRLVQHIYEGSVRVKEIDGLDPLTDDENVDIDRERDIGLLHSSTSAPGSEKITAIMKRHDDFANELDEAEEMCASRRRVSLDLEDTLRVDLPCERDRNEAMNEQDEIEQIQGSRRRVSLDL